MSRKRSRGNQDLHDGRPLNRVINLDMDASDALDHCRAKDVGVSAVEALPGGGIRLVCMSVSGAETIRRRLKANLLGEDAPRHKLRSRRGAW